MTHHNRGRETVRMEDLSTRIAFAIRRQRRYLDWKQTELAEHAGVSRGTVQRIERGGDVWLSTFLAIVGALELDVERMFEPNAPRRREGDEAA